jgi:hypothetical protein
VSTKVLTLVSKCIYFEKCQDFMSSGFETRMPHINVKNGVLLAAGSVPGLGLFGLGVDPD